MFAVGSVKVAFDNRGFIDFHPAADVGVLFLNESELITGSNYKQRILKLAKVYMYRNTARFPAWILQITIANISISPECLHQPASW